MNLDEIPNADVYNFRSLLNHPLSIFIPANDYRETLGRNHPSYTWSTHGSFLKTIGISESEIIWRHYNSDASQIDFFWKDRVNMSMILVEYLDMRFVYDH